MEISYLIQQLINGITLGALYGLIAIGYSMVYGVLGMINFAHGEVFMLGALATLLSIAAALSDGFSPLVSMGLAMVAAMIICAGVAVAVERIAYRPLQKSFRLAPFISAVGVSIILQNAVQIFLGARDKAMPPILQGGWVVLPGEFEVTLSKSQALIIVCALIAMLASHFLVQKTAFGRAQRAVQQDRGMAAILGIKVSRVVSLTFALGAVLAALAGFLFAVQYGVVNFFIGFMAGIKAFTAAVLGGIGSLTGAVLGGILIGLIETFWTAQFGGDYKDIATFMVLILVLIFRPSGLLGKPEVQKV